VDAGRVHCTYRWIIEDNRVLGAITPSAKTIERHGGILEDVRVRGYLGERDGVVGQESHGPFGREVGDLSGT
jgi:predicted acetyltransferase